MPRLRSIVWCLLAASLAAADERQGTSAAAPSPAELRSDPGLDSPLQAVSGAYTYKTHCATCHGADGKGEGPLAAKLRFHPPDLTTIASRHGGKYPTEEVHRIVDGRKPLQGHGGPEMPIWGDAFKNSETGYDEAAAQERIRSVVEYVRTLQAPAKK